MRPALILLVIPLLVACAAEPKADPCAHWEAPAQEGQVENAELDELSGLAASRSQPGLLWAHNDGGDIARVFALGTDGQDRGVFVLSGLSATDWEDMAIGPGPDGGDWLYLGDIGDNDLERESVLVHRFPEPDGSSGGDLISEVETLELVYPEGPADAETLLIDPRLGDLYILTLSEDGRSTILRAAAPLSGDAPIELEEVGTLLFGTDELPGSPKLRAGDANPQGAVYLRTNNRVFLFPRPVDGDGPLHHAFEAPPCSLPSPDEPDGEALAATADGFYTAGEGSSVPIWWVGR